MDLLTATITPATAGFLALMDESIHLRFNMLRRLDENWRSGDNRFDAPGEKLLGVLCEGSLVGVCGLNRDPYVPQARTGRLRHLYVGAKWRRMHIGTRLLHAVMNDAGQHFDSLNIHAPDSAFAFYEQAGFVRLNGVNKVTHRLCL